MASASLYKNPAWQSKTVVGDYFKQEKTNFPVQFESSSSEIDLRKNFYFQNPASAPEPPWSPNSCPTLGLKYSFLIVTLRALAL